MTTEPNPTRTAVDRYGPWVALYAAVGLTASGEYALAHLVGFPGLIAALLPTAIDIYVIQAMRRHRDVAAALILMVATNALYHLADAGLLGVNPAGRPSWWLIVAVAAIAPVIVWRVHRITETTELPVPVADTTPVLAPAKTPRQDAPPAAKNTTEPAPTAPTTPAPLAAPKATPVADNTPATADNTSRQETTTTPAPADMAPAKTAARKRANTAPSRPGKKAPRRSLSEWVDLAGPIFHAEFARLRRQPTANEFATAIDAAGLGKVSDSTAKNIRTEILDRTDVPALDQTD